MRVIAGSCKSRVFVQVIVLLVVVVVVCGTGRVERGMSAAMMEMRARKKMERGW